MANDNTRNRPRYPLDRRWIRTLIRGDETVCETPAAGETEDGSGAVCAMCEDVPSPARNPFGTAFK